MRDATTAYLHALNEMSGTKPGELARIADRKAGAAFDKDLTPSHVKEPSCDNMMKIETMIFTALCEANGVNWRYLV